MNPARIEYHTAPQLEVYFKNLIAEFTNLPHDEIGTLSWTIQHEDEIETKVNIDFDYKGVHYGPSFHNLIELREWLTETL